jgi:hypothetical protein
MMAKLGFEQGGTLGAATNTNAITEPLEPTVKEDRGGIGMDTERKRKFREQAEGVAKRAKAEEGGFRERMARGSEEKRLEGQIIGAMNVAERMDGQDQESKARYNSTNNGIEIGEKGSLDEADQIRGGHRSTRKVNVLWRNLVRDREEKERDRRMRYDLLQSLSRSATYDDPEEDNIDRMAVGGEVEEVEEEDPELDAFNALTPAERLERLVKYLRDTYHYCLWCKYRYPDSAMEGCPGLTEDDHD